MLTDIYFFFSENWKYLDVTFVFELMLSFLIGFNFFFFQFRRVSEVLRNPEIKNGGSDMAAIG